MGATLAFFCVGIVVASMLGGLLPLASVLTHTRLQAYLSFAAGSMLGAAFFHMLPEAVETGSADALQWTAWGLLALFFLERYFSFHHHEAPEDPADPCPPHAHEHSHAHGPGHSAGVVDAGAARPRLSPEGPVKGSALHWGAAAFGLAAHTLVGGIALASASAAGEGGAPGPAAWSVFLATVVHKPADALTLVSLMLRSGLKKPVAHLVNLAFSLMIPAGVLLFFTGRYWAVAAGDGRFTSSTLAFSAGTFLCIALSDILPELQFHQHDRMKLSLALLFGFGLMGLTGLFGE